MSQAMIQTTPTTELKICNRCVTELPLESFDRKRRGSEDRRSICHKFDCQKQRERRQKRQLGEFSAFARKVHRRKDRPGQIESLCAVMMKRFGGRDKFTKLWADLIKSESSSIAMRLRQCRAIGELIMISSQMRQPPNPDELSDDELAAEILDAATSVVANHPELVLEAAEALGAKVTWPAADTVSMEQDDG